MIPFFMPSIFLEGFERHNKNNPSIKKIPNIIFTSYKHISDDSFKIWASKFIDKGSKLIIGCHGGGVPLLFNDSKDFESEIANILLVTGSKNNIYKNSYNVGQFWARLKYKTYNRKGGALIIGAIHPRYAIEIHSFAISSQMIRYFKDQFSFYNSLSKHIRENTKVRLYPNNYGWEEKQRWKDNCKEVQFANNQENFNLQIRKFRLLVATYNATTFIEFLAANIPVIIFWDKEIWQCTNFAEEDFQKLSEVGIFHTDYFSASNMINKIWDNVDNWWNSNNLQKVRQSFCKQYGDRDTNSTKNIISIFEQALDSRYK